MQVVAADFGYGQVKWVAGSRRGRFEAAWVPHTPGVESWGIGSQPELLLIGDQGVIAGDRAASLPGAHRRFSPRGLSDCDALPLLARGLWEHRRRRQGGSRLRHSLRRLRARVRGTTGDIGAPYAAAVRRPEGAPGTHRPAGTLLHLAYLVDHGIRHAARPEVVRAPRFVQIQRRPERAYQEAPHSLPRGASDTSSSRFLLSGGFGSPGLKRRAPIYSSRKNCRDRAVERLRRADHALRPTPEGRLKPRQPHSGHAAPSSIPRHSQPLPMVIAVHEETEFATDRIERHAVKWHAVGNKHVPLDHLYQVHDSGGGVAEPCQPLLQIR